MELTILDGGMGAELRRREPRNRSGLWSAQALVDAPELVAEVHRDYIDAGAQIIITNTYSTIPSYLGKAGLEADYLRYAGQAGQIARDVAAGVPGTQVAGSLPPLDESYRWDLVPSAEDALPIYRALARTLLPYVDLFICETMSCIGEAVNAVSIAREVGGRQVPVWVSWTLDETPGGGLRSGESIGDAFAALDDFAVDAYLFNCTSPEAITEGLKTLVTLTQKPVGAYPNLLHIPSGWTLDNDVAAGYREMTPATFTDFAREWQAIGASIIGGCCGIGPEFIRRLPDLALA